MTNFRKGILVVLAIINVVLLAALIHVNMAPAKAYSFKTTDYVVVTGNMGSGLDAVYVIDLASNKMAAFAWDKTTKRVKGIDQIRELAKDFKTER